MTKHGSSLKPFVYIHIFLQFALPNKLYRHLLLTSLVFSKLQEKIIQLAGAKIKYLTSTTFWNFWCVSLRILMFLGLNIFLLYLGKTEELSFSISEKETLKGTKRRRKD